ncbi:HprK-related kinase A [Parasphingopyxis lamellibrachiae]|uniref:Hpr(Ser) kinase/phosphatase n=1 Tax=Parasphingopyxis lamellibrachiae TaxID=680125 RepID=A0A3D9FC29_9SPHN|nr:HprK-related kinase A [Parasphingopyxis lamellibrachiae]RED15127.1 Hpr(Ser) kinase/phosphatase [Parasphingopyxis lamellibrachiae]
MKHEFRVRVGPAGFRIGSDWKQPIDQLAALYSDYPAPDIPDFTVRLFAQRPWRRFLRPSVMIGGDYMLPDAAPVSLAHGLLAAEMGMNLQMALGQRRYLLLHASAVERDGKALLMTGHSGAGKSTLSALLGERGWRFMGDEFVLVDLSTAVVHAFPRLVSLKNEAITLFEGAVDADRLGPLMRDTPKGDIRHLQPPTDAIAKMSEPARPALLLFPRFGHAPDVREVGEAEVFVRLTQASTNYVALGEAGFDALSSLVRTIPTRAVDYPDTENAVASVERLWMELAE